MASPTSTSLETKIDSRIHFGRPANRIRFEGSHPTLELDLPVLAGSATEDLLPGARESGEEQGFAVFRREDHLLGFAVARRELGLEQATVQLYQRLFDLARARHLHRIWNFVPQINAEPEGLENYRRFCRGRSHAFEDRFGSEFKRFLPAASAVGSRHGPLAVIFLAGPDRPRNFENALQVPAFEYPEQYGPRSPSFVRASVRQLGGQRQILVSGTAAIRGHASVATDDLEGQLHCTLDNLKEIAQTAGAEAGNGAALSRQYRVYLRRPVDLPATRQTLQRDLLQAGDSVQYLQADLCRAELLVEIEAILTSRLAD